MRKTSGGASLILGMVAAMDAIGTEAANTGSIVDNMNSMIPSTGGDFRGGFYSIGKTEMTKVQKNRRKKAKSARRARRNNR